MINELFFKENKDINYLVKLMQISFTLLIKSIKYYCKKINQKSLQFKYKIINRIEIFLNIKNIY